MMDTDRLARHLYNRYTPDRDGEGIPVPSWGDLGATYRRRWYSDALEATAVLQASTRGRLDSAEVGDTVTVWGAEGDTPGDASENLMAGMGGFHQGVIQSLEVTGDDAFVTLEPGKLIAAKPYAVSYLEVRE